MSNKPQAWITDRRGPTGVAFLGRLSEDIDPAAALRSVDDQARDIRDLVVNRQVHSSTVVDADSAPSAADGLISAGSQLKQRALAVFTADCVPVLLSDLACGRVAALHAGWRGLVSGIISEGWSQFGLKASSATTAWIGPSIGPCCYQVSEEVAVAVARKSGAGVVLPPPQARFGWPPSSSPESPATAAGGQVPSWATAVSNPSKNGLPHHARRPHLDLVAAATAQLERLGIEDIRRLAPCTHCDQRWHSYRRDGAGGGRNYGVIWTTP